LPAASPRPRDRRRLVLLAAIVAVVLLAGAAWFFVRLDSRRTDAGAPLPSAATSPAAPAASSSPSPSSSSSSPSVRSSSSAGIPARPAGWTDYHDPTGFALYVPTGWSRSKEGGIVYFRSAGKVLGIDQTDDPQWNPVADWQGKAAYRVSHGDFPAYHQIKIKAVSYHLKAADWEFTFTRGGARQHVNNRGFITSKHQAYGIWWQTTDAAWPAARSDLQLIFDSFRPDEG
jgi:hypothetical protein